MSAKRIVVAGTESGVGKTTVTMGLMAALRKKGFEVQGFKCGPDFIDPTFHTVVTNRLSRNLDSWMLSEEVILHVLAKGSRNADISIIEGVMGMYDGDRPETNKGSTAHIASITRTPVLLVIDCKAQARSAAAVVKGFQLFSKENRIVGVIANRVGGRGHFKLIKKAVEKECGIPVVGYLTEEENFSLPERHLGLIPADEQLELEEFSDKLASAIVETVDIDKIVRLSEATPVIGHSKIKNEAAFEKVVTIAIARDEAFHFYYEENIDLLKEFGAECVYFSPLHDRKLPECDGIYIGGGFPEEFAQTLSRNSLIKTAIADAINRGTPVIAECGGFMYLCEELVQVNKARYKMVGIIEGDTMVHEMLQSIRYVEFDHNDLSLVPYGKTVRGHEFRYSSYTQPSVHTPSHVFATFTHLHFASCPEVAKAFVALCYKRR
ncbi:cobyrinate a,c-diamide synthase [Alteribacter aurantiacus]|uniref:cobyrinate a,c-diamide synthase n=1 Tax=Alteribacter aurantiacus TaxID=254410 RepID=UPI000411BA61|nr:cobyrinate a,c-diamide synthase [Alteribacter aurantiacus]